MKVLSKIIIPFLIATLIISCQNNKSKPNPDLLSIDLLRGDIALCGDPEFGRVNFRISCDYSVQETFDLAVSLLHSFEYSEAEKAFVKVMDADPSCAMAYWGVAMSIYHALWFAPNETDLEKGSKLIEIAESISKTPREQEYLSAIGVFYKDWKKIDHMTRARKMEKKMEEIYKKYEDDTEAAIFYALTLKSTADEKDKSYLNQRKAGKILESIFPDQPNHPGIAHYIIHNYDYPELAHLALSTARKYAEIAPASAHAQHMPSHIFTRLGLWEESIQTNLNSASSAVCYTESVEMEGYWFQETHAMDYLVYAYLQKGDNSKALDQLQHMQTMNKVNPANISAIAYPFAAIPARIVLENRQWAAAANLKLHKSDLQWDQHPWEKSIIYFTRALGAAHLGDIEAADNEVALLQSSRQELLDIGDKYSADMVLVQIKSSEAWISFARGDFEEAIGFMRSAADIEDGTGKHPVSPCEVLPARELLGDLFLALNKPSEALEAYEESLMGHQNRFNGIYGVATAAKRTGDQEKATQYFKLLMTLVESSDSNRPEIEEAREFIEKIES